MFEATVDGIDNSMSHASRGGGSDVRKVYLHADAFALMQQVQRGQSGSPRFDLKDLTSAAIKAFLRDPNAHQLIERQARLDFASRALVGDLRS